MDKGIALITGAATGIGQATCFALASEGFQIAIHCNKNLNNAKAISEKIENSFVIQSDISTIDGVQHLADIILKREKKLSVIVNNAGITKDSFIISSSLEDFDEVINTNVRSAWYLTKRLVKSMMRNKSGRIINISSVIAHTANSGQMLYGMSKSAIENFTKSAALEFAPYGILVNAIAPGFIETSMTDGLPLDVKQKILDKIPLGRMGQPEEVAQLVSFLATKATFCTGSTFHINGGMYVG